MSAGPVLSNPLPAFERSASFRKAVRWSMQGALGLLAVFCVWMLVEGTPPWSRDPLPENPSRRAALEYHLSNGLWQAAAFGLVVSGLLLVLARQWTVRGASVLAPAESPPIKPFLVFLAPILVLAMIVRVPLLDHSLYGDEHYSITRFIHGEQRLAKDGGTEFRQIEWKQTIWGYQRPNNHIFFSIIARATHSTWQKLVGANPEVVDVRVLRVPAMVAAVVSIGVAAWLLWSHGFYIGAGLAALLLALHPWHIAHSVEVRGYGFVFLFFATTAVSALAALRNGRWLAWSALAASQFFLLHTYPKAILIAAPTSIALLVVLALRARREPVLANALLGPFLATQSLLAMALGFAYLPCAPQLAEYFATVAPKGTMSVGWLLDVVSLYLVGRYWQEWEPDNLLCRSLGNEVYAFPWLALPVIGLLALLGIRGGILICRKNPWMALLLAPAVVSIPLALLHARNTEAYIFTWHMIMPLPLWLMCVGVGVESACRTGRPTLRALLVPSLAFLAFLQLSSPQRQVVCHFPAEPINETYASLTEHLAGFDGSAPNVYAMFSLVDFHDPKIRKLRGEEVLMETVSRYQTNGSPFFLVLPGLHSLRENNPRVADLLESSGQFRLLARHHGLEFAHRSYDLWFFGEK